MNCATALAALPSSLEAVFQPFIKKSSRSIHSAETEDFLYSFDGTRRYPLFVEVQSESQRLVPQSVPVA